MPASIPTAIRLMLTAASLRDTFKPFIILKSDSNVGLAGNAWLQGKISKSIPTSTLEKNLTNSKNQAVQLLSVKAPTYQLTRKSSIHSLQTLLLIAQQIYQ